MKDWSIAVGEGETSLHQLAVNLVEEAELYRIGGSRPDGEVAPLLGQASAEIALICWFHAVRVVDLSPRSRLLMSNIKP